ncbi:unnamed protein product [Rotaria sordida]|uniref:Uncharacterized protein n=1 Tax=Rotaria sordida TaxID=392033 RepID=A0A814PWI5_9BILA|nr:unnamed protein product [Rotaria sordida]
MIGGRPECPRFRDDLATGINVVKVKLDVAVTDEDDDVDDDLDRLIYDQIQVFFPEETLQKRIDRERDDTMKKLKKCMSEITDLAKIPLTLPLYKSYSDRLRSCLTQSYMTIIPLIDQIRALRELKMVQSIRKKLKRHKLILGETDKSGVLHIGRQIDYERKAAEYRQTTGAYEELTSNPFNDIICQVARLLKQLQSMKKITEW